MEKHLATAHSGAHIPECGATPIIELVDFIYRDGADMPINYSHLNDEIHMERNVRGRKDCLFSHVALGDNIIHTFNDEMHMGKQCTVCKYEHYLGGRETIHLSDSHHSYA